MTRDAALEQCDVSGPIFGETPLKAEPEDVPKAETKSYELAGAALPNNRGREHQMVKAAQTGVMNTNEYGGTGEEVPFGKVGWSAISANTSRHAIESYGHLKTEWIGL